MKKISGFLKFLRNWLFFQYLRIFGSHPSRKKYYLSFCGIFKNEGKYLKEWLDYHLLAGVEHFYLYNNFSEDNYCEVLAPYIDKGIVTLIDWPHQQGQMSAYKDCIKKFSNESNWIGFIDLDEFVCPIKYRDIKNWLKQYEKFPMVSAFWRMFSSSGHLKEENHIPVIERFIVCGKMHHSSKMFLNTAWSSKIKEFKIAHYARFKIFKNLFPAYGAFYYGLIDDIKNPDIQINHYFNKSYEYYCRKKMPCGDVYRKGRQYNLQSFYEFEDSCYKTNFHIFKYLIRLKTFDLDEFVKNKEV